MANDFLKMALPYLELMKARNAGMNAPMTAQLSQEEREGLVPIKSPEEQTYALSEGASPEEAVSWESYKAQAKPAQSVADQLKPFLPQPKQPSIMDLMPKSDPKPISRELTGAPPVDPATELAPQEAGLGSTLDFGSNSLANQQGLQEAQGRQNDLQFLANMNRAFGQVGAGLAQTDKPDTSVADSVERQGKQQVDNYKEQVEFQKQDPNSSYSKGLKDYFKNKLKMEIRGDASAAELEKIMPFAVREYEAQLERERLKTQKADDMAFKKEEAAKDRDLKRDLLSQGAENKKVAQDEKLAAKEKENQNSFIERTSKQLEKHSTNLVTLRNAKSAIDAAVKNPSSIKDVGALYSFIKALDPGSVVREGEIELANRASGLFGGLTLKLSQLTTNPKLITSKNLKDIQDSIAQLHDLANSEYDLRRQTSYKRAKARNITEDRFGEFDPYHAEASQRSSQGLVKIRQKSTGAEKTISSENAKKYLSDKDFEEVK